MARLGLITMRDFMMVSQKWLNGVEDKKVQHLVFHECIAIIGFPSIARFNPMFGWRIANRLIGRLFGKESCQNIIKWCLFIRNMDGGKRYKSVRIPNAYDMTTTCDCGGLVTLRVAVFIWRIMVWLGPLFGRCLESKNNYYLEVFLLFNWSG